MVIALGEEVAHELEADVVSQSTIKTVSVDDVTPVFTMVPEIPTLYVPISVNLIPALAPPPFKVHALITGLLPSVYVRVKDDPPMGMTAPTVKVTLPTSPPSNKALGTTGT